MYVHVCICAYEHVKPEDFSCHSLGAIQANQWLGTHWFKYVLLPTDARDLPFYNLLLTQQISLFSTELLICTRQMFYKGNLPWLNFHILYSGKNRPWLQLQILRWIKITVPEGLISCPPYSHTCHLCHVPVMKVQQETQSAPLLWRPNVLSVPWLASVLWMLACWTVLREQNWGYHHHGSLDQGLA